MNTLSTIIRFLARIVLLVVIGYALGRIFGNVHNFVGFMAGWWAMIVAFVAKMIAITAEMNHGRMDSLFIFCSMLAFLRLLLAIFGPAKRGRR